MPPRPYKSLLSQARDCSLCADELEHGVRPIFQVHPDASILIAGQAPGAKVHESGVPFDDPSGDRLREWMGVDRELFYDPRRVAILPMGFCYPGRGRTGDLPPVPRCAETWRKKLLAVMPNVGLTLVIGQYAMDWHLSNREKTLTETVKNWSEYPKNILPLPHPSPRNNIWLKKNGWFEKELLPVLRRRVLRLL